MKRNAENKEAVDSGCVENEEADWEGERVRAVIGLGNRLSTLVLQYDAHINYMHMHTWKPLQLSKSTY